MRIFIRIVLTLYILCMLCVAVIALACAWNIIGIGYPLSWVKALYSDTWTIIVVSVVGVVLVGVSFLLMFSRSKKREPKAALITNTQNGAISISLSAIEEMATKHILSNEAIRNVKINVGFKDAKTNLFVKLAVAEGTNMPEVLQNLQVSTKQEIEKYAGIEIGKIVMLVEKTAHVVKARVE